MIKVTTKSIKLANDHVITVTATRGTEVETIWADGAEITSSTTTVIDKTVLTMIDPTGKVTRQVSDDDMIVTLDPKNKFHGQLIAKGAVATLGRWGKTQPIGEATAKLVRDLIAAVNAEADTAEIINHRQDIEQAQERAEKADQDYQDHYHAVTKLMRA